MKNPGFGDDVDPLEVFARVLGSHADGEFTEEVDEDVDLSAYDS